VCLYVLNKKMDTLRLIELVCVCVRERGRERAIESEFLSEREKNIKNRSV